MIGTIRSGFKAPFGFIKYLVGFVLLAVFILILNAFSASRTSQITGQPPAKQSKKLSSVPPPPIKYDVSNWLTYEDPGGHFRFQYPEGTRTTYKEIDPALDYAPFRYVDLKLPLSVQSKVKMRVSVGQRPPMTTIDQVLQDEITRYAVEDKHIPDHIRKSMEVPRQASVVEGIQAYLLQDGQILVRIVSRNWIYELSLLQEAYGNDEAISMFATIVQSFEVLK